MLFISQFRPLQKKNIDTTKINSSIQKVFSLLCKISKETKIKFKVLGSQINKEKEVNFYQKINKNFIFLSRNLIRAIAYEEIDKAKLVVTIDSTLGYESLARYNKTLFICIRKSINKTNVFGWPNYFKDKGLCWTNVYDEKYIREKIINLLKLPNKKWKILSKKIAYKNMVYNKNNSLLRNFIKEIILDIKKNA